MNRKLPMREEILQLIDEYSLQEFEWEAKFLGITGARFTISQLRRAGNSKIFATHLNLPIGKIEIGEVFGFKKGESIRFKAAPCAYLQNGVRRGSLKALEKNQKIKIDYD